MSHNRYWEDYNRMMLVYTPSSPVYIEPSKSRDISQARKRYFQLLCVRRRRISKYKRIASVIAFIIAFATMCGIAIVTTSLLNTSTFMSFIVGLWCGVTGIAVYSYLEYIVTKDRWYDKKRIINTYFL